MAISVASTTAFPQTPATDVATANTTQTQQANGTTSPFQALLASATGTAQPTTTTTPTTAADTLASDLADNALDNTTNDTTTGTTNTNLNGLLALAAQVLGLPANAAVAQATGQTAPATATTADETTRNRADQLRLGRAGGFPSAGVFLNRPTANTALANANAANALTQPTTTQTTTPATNQETATTTAATATAAVPALAPNSVATQTAVAVRGGTSIVPAQAPIVTDLIPNAPVPAGLSVTAPPVDAPPATAPTAAVPSAQLGDRPATTGDRFAAIAEAGAQLAPTAAPGSVIFANTLTQELTAPATAFGTAITVEAPKAVAGTGDTVLPLVNLNTQATSAVVLPAQRTPEPGPTDARKDDANTSAVASGVVNPQAPLPPFAQIASTSDAAPAAPAVQVADAVVSHAHVLEREGGVEFRMRLDPPDLGRVQIQLVTRGDEVHGQVLCASDAVRQMIESQLPELRQRLEAAGVNVQQFSVATDPNTGGGNQNAYRAAMFEEFAPRTTATSAPAPRARIGTPDTGSLDVTV